MLDLLALVITHRIVSRRARDRGYGSLYSAPAMLGYLVGEVAGFVIAARMDMGLGVYLMGFGLAAIGAAAGFLFVARLPPRLDLKHLSETFQ